MGADIAAGVSWSVPAGVLAQKQFDRVMWINYTDSHMGHWDATEVYYTISDMGGKLELKYLPSPFEKPDVVVFEGFYSFPEVRFSWELRRKSIPYIVIPRGSLTKQAFHNHNWRNYLKKKIASFFIFRPYTRHALAVQFLTKQELEDSGNSWTKHPIIIPNGFDNPVNTKTSFSERGLELIYIGRPTIHQKGLDLLIDACIRMKKELRDNNVHISLHAPEKNDYKQLVCMLKDANIPDVLTLKPSVTGKEKEKCLLNSDVFVMTSRFEGHPMGLIEALAYGLPVVVTPGTNMAKEIANSDSGWVCDGTVEGICEALKAVVSDKALLMKKSANAKKLASDYRWDNLAKQFHNTIEQLLTAETMYK